MDQFTENSIKRYIRKMEKKLLKLKKDGGVFMKVSEKYSLNKGDLKSVAITVLLAALSAGVAQLIQSVPNINFGQNSEVITVVILGGLKLLQKFIRGK